MTARIALEVALAVMLAITLYANEVLRAALFDCRQSFADCANANLELIVPAMPWAADEDAAHGA